MKPKRVRRCPAQVELELVAQLDRQKRVFRLAARLARQIGQLGADPAGIDDQVAVVGYLQRAIGEVASKLTPEDPA